MRDGVRRIRLDQADVARLVRGQVVKFDGLEIALAGVGFAWLVDEVRAAQAETAMRAAGWRIDG
jgi:hypothetical protein